MLQSSDKFCAMTPINLPVFSKPSHKIQSVPLAPPNCSCCQCTSYIFSPPFPIYLVSLWCVCSAHIRLSQFWKCHSIVFMTPNQIPTVEKPLLINIHIINIEYWPPSSTCICCAIFINLFHKSDFLDKIVTNVIFGEDNVLWNMLIFL